MTYEKTEQELNRVNRYYKETTKKLKDWEEGWDGQRLKELWRGEKEKFVEEFIGLKKEKEKLEVDKNKWGDQMIFLQKELSKFSDEKGNE